MAEGRPVEHAVYSDMKWVRLLMRLGYGRKNRTRLQALIDARGAEKS